MTKFAILAVPVLLILGACEKGPAEQAGEQADRATEARSGDIYTGDGPQENMGEAIDQASEARQERSADAVENKADQIRDSAEQRADKMENKADATRDKAEKQADAVENQADKIRDQKPAP